jgi:predicted membrane metal-binding protein
MSARALRAARVAFVGALVACLAGRWTAFAASACAAPPAALGMTSRSRASSLVSDRRTGTDHVRSKSTTRRQVSGRVCGSMAEPKNFCARQRTRSVARLRPPRLEQPGRVRLSAGSWSQSRRDGRPVRRARRRRRASAACVARFAARIAERIGAALRDPDAAPLVTALAIGERYRPPKSTGRTCGAYGHSAISPRVHARRVDRRARVLAARAVIRLLRPAELRPQIAAVASALCTAYYAALTGLVVPAQRSLPAVVVALALPVSRRSVGATRARRDAARRAVWDPFLSLSASLWLSHAP